MLQIMFNMQCRMAIALFKHMKASGFEPNAATYCIMIDCCRTIRCYKSAWALVSMMLRSGFYLQTVGYTALIKVYALASLLMCHLN
jgi:pentatricopeptide repeat protein